jgi:hypothetical protein
MEKAAKNIPFLERKGIVAEESGLGEERRRPRSEEVGNRAQVLRLMTGEICTEIIQRVLVIYAFPPPPMSRIVGQILRALNGEF